LVFKYVRPWVNCAFAKAYKCMNESCHTNGWVFIVQQSTPTKITVRKEKRTTLKFLRSHIIRVIFGFQICAAMSQLRIRKGVQMHEWVMSHKWMSVAAWCSLVQRGAVRRSVLQCVTVCCNVLQYAAACCSEWVVRLQGVNTYMNKPCHAQEYAWISHVTHMNTPCHTAHPKRTIDPRIARKGS